MRSEDFKTIEIAHKEVFDRFFLEDPPQTSELSFTNLFIWRHRYRPIWLEWEHCLLIILRPDGSPPFGLPPIGTGNKKEALNRLFEVLKKLTDDGKVSRVGENFVDNYLDRGRYQAVLDPDNSDYVYRTQDLIRLSGRKYHRKKNHLNRFLRTYQFKYRKMDSELAEDLLDMQARWCEMKECINNPALLSEDYAVREALIHFEDLEYQGAAIEIDSKIEAFALGEPLNSDTAVIHIEKANPDIPDLYVAINQLFCRNAWSHLAYVNREQDLGIEGLRKAKESYYPHHKVNKYSIIPK